jgi:hypothetical protein
MLVYGTWWEKYYYRDVMKQAFLKKYQDYSKARDLSEEIFKMTQKEDESLGDYV